MSTRAGWVIVFVPLKVSHHTKNNIACNVLPIPDPRSGFAEARMRRSWEWRAVRGRGTQFLNNPQK